MGALHAVSKDVLLQGVTRLYDFICSLKRTRMDGTNDVLDIKPFGLAFGEEAEVHNAKD